MKSFKSAYVALSLLGVLILAGQAQAGANPMVSLKPGDTLQREFVLFNEINFARLGPVQLFLVIASGTEAAPIGDITIAVKSYIPGEPFGTDIDYTLRGIALPITGGAAPAPGTPVQFSMINTVPSATAFPATAATKTVTINATYGVALLAVYISNVDGDTNGEPVRFSIIFSAAVKK